MSREFRRILQSKLVNEVLLRCGTVELINQEIFAATASFELADQ